MEGVTARNFAPVFWYGRGMAIILRSQLDGKKYLLVGTGSGETESSTRASFYDRPSLRRSSTQWTCVCDGAGKLFWLPAEAVVVEEIDGRPVAAWGLDTWDVAAESASPAPSE